MNVNHNAASEPNFETNMEESIKNTSKKSSEIIQIENDLSVLLFNNEEAAPVYFQKTIGRDVIQFYYCTEGEGIFHFAGGNYKLPIAEDKSFLFYNPNKDLAIDLEIRPGTKILMLLISIDRIHSLFVENSEYLHFLRPEASGGRKFYVENQIGPRQKLVIQDFFAYNLNKKLRALFYQGKVLELLSLHFNTPENEEDDNCPFLSDADNVDKIKRAKNLLIEHLTDPPSLEELAKEVGLNVYRLKVGFKNIYGDTVFGFLKDYKLEYARRLMDENNHKVNEVAYAIGYTNPSHFISAFKKKYGITPKKYLINLK